MALFTSDEIRCISKQNAKFERALLCVHNVHERDPNEAAKNVEETEINITCRCYGSGNSCYEITIKISKQSKDLLKASCSCPYMQKSSKDGDVCKHILAALLKYCCYEQKGNEAKSECKKLPRIEDISTFPTRKRQLPSWIESKKDHMDCNDKRRKNMHFLRTSETKRSSKQTMSVMRTVYCMTPEEFKKTAQQILQAQSAEKMPKDPLSFNKECLVNHDQNEEEVIENNKISHDHSHLQTWITGETSIVTRRENVESMKEEFNSKVEFGTSDVASRTEKYNICSSESVNESLEKSSCGMLDLFVNPERSMIKEDISMLDDLL